MMARYAVMALVEGAAVMGDTIEAADAGAARAACEAAFWGAADDLRAAMPTMNECDRWAAARMVESIEGKQERARAHGLTVTARKR